MSWLMFVLHEKIILLFGSIIFVMVAVLLIHWGVQESYVMQVFGLASGMIGALLRGITGEKNENTGNTPSNKNTTP